jgi:lipopolysaccharide biosynthesis protein
MKRLCIFAHYDIDDLVDEYVSYYLDSLKTVSSQIIFVTTSKISAKACANLKTVCDHVLIRKNIGYDFVSWKTGLRNAANISDFDELIICNDSVYGPLYPLKDIFERMTNNDCDSWGMTQSNAIAYHIQSYFLVFKRHVIQSKAFRDFWNSMRIEDRKRDVIEKYEVGLSQTLLSAGFKLSAYAPYSPPYTKVLSIMAGAALRKPARAISKIFKIIKGKSGLNYKSLNPAHLLWKNLIVKYQMPFLKVELLRDNPTKVNIKEYENVIKKYTNYDINLIRNHLERIKRKST